MLLDQVRFTDSAAARAFEHGLDHSEVLQALRNGHFKQPAIEQDRFVHYVKVSGRPLKIVTGPSLINPAETAIIGILPLDVGGER